MKPEFLNEVSMILETQYKINLKLGNFQFHSRNLAPQFLYLFNS